MNTLMFTGSDAGLLQPGLDGLEVHEDLALVVGRCRARRSRRRARWPRTAARSTGPADPPAARRSGRRRGSSARPRRPATRRRRRDCLASRSAARSAGRCARARFAVHSAHRADVAACSRQRADARDGEVVLQLVDVAIAMEIDEIDDLVVSLTSSCLLSSAISAILLPVFDRAARPDRPTRSTMPR